MSSVLPLASSKDPNQWGSDVEPFHMIGVQSLLHNGTNTGGSVITAPGFREQA